MGAQVVRLETRSGVRGNLADHIIGRKRPAHANEVPKPVLHMGIDADGDLEPITLDEAAKRLDEAADFHAQLKREHRLGRYPGREPKAVGEFVIAGPPRFNAPDAWTTERKMGWAAESVLWVRRSIGPASKIALATIHLDEAAPHVHVLFVMADAERRMGLNRIAAKLCRDAQVKKSGASVFRRMQDSYQAEVGKKYGLARGEPSKRKNERSDATISKLVQSVDRLERMVTKGVQGVVQALETDPDLARRVSVALDWATKKQREIGDMAVEEAKQPGTGFDRGGR